MGSNSYFQRKAYFMASSAFICERFLLNFLEFYFSISFVNLKANFKKLQENVPNLR